MDNKLRIEAVESLKNEHFEFIEKELGISKARLLKTDGPDLIESVYNGLCRICLQEYDKAESFDWSERWTMADDIVYAISRSDDDPADAHPCPCCGQTIFTRHDSYEICSICNWEDDGLQENHPYYPGGANDMSLNQAREAYKTGKPVK